MPSTFVLRCPGCRARIKAPRQLIGKRRNCPGCDTPLVVRIQPLQDSDPLLVATDHRAPRQSR